MKIIRILSRVFFLLLMKEGSGGKKIVGEKAEEKIHGIAKRVNDKRKMRCIVGNKRVRGEDI